VDDAGIDRADRLVIDAKPFGGTGAHRMHQHIRRTHQIEERGPRVGFLQVEHDRALVAVGVEE